MSSWRVSAILMLAALLSPGVAVAGPIAVVVNPSNSVVTLSIEDLRHYYLGRESTFPDGRHVLLGVDTSTSERSYETITGLSSNQFKKHWIKQVFSGTAASPPESFRDADALLTYVAENPGAVAFLDASLVDERVKVIAVEGAMPGAPGYPLGPALADPPAVEPVR